MCSSTGWQNVMLGSWFISTSGMLFVMLSSSEVLLAVAEFLVSGPFSFFVIPSPFFIWQVGVFKMH